MRVLFLLLACVGLSQAVAGQKAVKPTASSDASPDASPTAQQDTIPTITLEFKKDAAIPGVPASWDYETYIPCTATGVPVVAFPKPYDPAHYDPMDAATFMPSIYSLDPKGGHSYSVAMVPDLYDLRYSGYLVANSLVGVRVNATPDPTRGPRTIQMPHGATRTLPNAYTGERREYLIEFDLDGNYKKTLQFPEIYSFARIAALPDGKFVAAAYDRANRVPRLVVLDSNLHILAPLQIPEGLADDPVLQQGETGEALNAAKAQSSMGSWMFGTARDRVLLYKAHSGSPVLEVGAGGSVREVPVQTLPDYQMERVIAANDRWLFVFRKQGLTDRGPIDARPQSGLYLTYEVDPNDGSLRRRIDLPPMDEQHPVANIACIQDGIAISFLSDGKQMIRYTADMPR